MKEWWQGLPSIMDVEVSQGSGSQKPLPGQILPCMLCKKPFLMRKYLGPPDQICSECFKTYADAAKIVCVKCKAVIARVKPEVLDSGFYIRPKAVLHTDKCGMCYVGTEERWTSTVIEVAEWETRIGRRKTTIFLAKLGPENVPTITKNEKKE